MFRYVVKRVLLAIVTVFIICAITFFLMHAVPGGPFNREKALSQATIDALNARYNLDKPLGTQFLLYLKGLMHGDFGVSLKNGREIKAIIGESFPISARLGLSAIGVALLLGTVFGSIAALTRNKLPDRVIIFFSTLFTAVPSFVLATLLLLIFCIRLGLLPVWLYTHCKGQGRFQMEDHFQARSEKFSYTRHHIRRATDRLYNYRLDGR